MDALNEKTKKKKKQITPFEAVYPPIDGYGTSQRKDSHALHVGYTTSKAKPCQCGSMPVFEQYVGDQSGTSRNVPARLFVAICPICERLAVGFGPLDAVLQAWNSGKWTDDSQMLQHAVDAPDSAGCKLLSDAVVESAVQEAVRLVERKNELMKLLKDPKNDMEQEIYYTELKGVRSSLRSLQRFFEESPLLYDKETDALLSGIRKILYPNLTFEERQKIPLKLVKM